VRSFLVLVLVGTLGFLAGCGGSNSTPVGVPITPQNVQAIAVDGGPVAGNIYPNGLFTSVTLCVPGTSTCQTIGGILVDTGSSGLRVLASQVTIPLKPLTDTSSDTLNDCIQFLDHSFLWGTVDPADVKMAGEVASTTSVLLIANPPTGTYTIPPACSTSGTGTNDDTQATLGANGILGVGLEPFDCGTICDPGAGGLPQEPHYYLCSTASCQPTFVSCGTLCSDTAANQQMTNPVFNFTTDNNGVIIELPALTGAGATVSGNMVFGIGTQSNNGLGTATVYTVDQFDNITTNFNNQVLNSSFIDSGSNGLFFPDSTIPVCPTTPVDFSSFFCPQGLTPLSATNVGSNSKQSVVNFNIDNAVNLFTNNPSDAAFSTLAGPLTNTSGCSSSTTPCTFDWGLPFFYGRNVFTAINGTTTPGGNGPYWAY
jgi:hypothetical protein